jgi:phosphoribosylanthranilate isomerase
MRPAFPNPLSATPQIKVCGLTRLSDALVCAEHGIDAIGINFWPKSKRFHALADASQWLEQVPESLTRVAVFVNASVEEVTEIMSSGLIDVAQFHGDETDKYVSHFLDTGIPVIRALSARSEADLEKIFRSPVRSILLDAYQPGVYGGTGQTCDWELAARAVKMFPEKHIILSGGITALNSAQAIREVHPVAIDLASGVESAPGIKDAEMIRLLANAVRSATSNPSLPHP